MEEEVTWLPTCWQARHLPMNELFHDAVLKLERMLGGDFVVVICQKTLEAEEG